MHPVSFFNTVLFLCILLTERCNGNTDEKVEFPFELTNEEFTRRLVEIYPKLESACFVFMKAGKKGMLEELNSGKICFRCYTPGNVYHSDRGQGRLYMRRIAENEVTLTKSNRCGLKFLLQKN